MRGYFEQTKVQSLVDGHSVEEEILYADLNLADARRKRNWNDFNQVLRDRRTDVYGEMLGSGVKRGWQCACWLLNVERW